MIRLMNNFLKISIILLASFSVGADEFPNQARNTNFNSILSDTQSEPLLLAAMQSKSEKEESKQDKKYSMAEYFVPKEIFSFLNEAITEFNKQNHNKSFNIWIATQHGNLEYETYVQSMIEGLGGKVKKLMIENHNNNNDIDVLYNISNKLRNPSIKNELIKLF